MLASGTREGYPSAGEEQVRRWYWVAATLARESHSAAPGSSDDTQALFYLRWARTVVIYFDPFVREWRL